MQNEIKIIDQLTNDQCSLLLKNTDQIGQLNPDELKNLRPVLRLHIPNRDAEWLLATYAYDLPLGFWGLENIGETSPKYKMISLMDLSPFVKLDAGWKAEKTLGEYHKEAIAYRMQSCVYTR